MAMRMPPHVAQQTAFPEVNRASLVFFGGLALIVLNFYWVNGSNLLAAIFHKGAPGQPPYGVFDTGVQVLGLALLTLIAEYGGENAGSAALLFVGALWLLWLVLHLGTTPGASTASGTPTPTSSPGGAGGGQKK